MATDTFQGGAAQIAFVFDDVADYQAVAAAFQPDVEVHVLDAAHDGLEQIAAILAQRSDVEALHVVGHGADGALDLGSLTLDAANVGAYSDVLGQIGAALAPDGDILLYGCNVAADAMGAQFVGKIAQATGADVAASTDATGGPQLGGDWTLEYSTGPVTAGGAFDAAAVHNLDTLLALPAAGLQDVTSSMTTSNFVPGFTLSANDTFLSDPGLGIYFYSTSDQSTETMDATLTVAADGANLGSFDLTDMGWLKYSGGVPGAYTFIVTGYHPDGTTVSTTFTSAANASGFDSTPDYSAFTNITKFDVEIQASTVTYPVSNWTFDSFTIANPHDPNTAPTFVSGTALTTTENNAADASSLLHVSDPDGYQTLTWSQSTGPAHGTLSISGATASGGGSNIAPGGTLVYTPTDGYVGTDSFKVDVSDGVTTATQTISVTVDPRTPTAPILTAGTDYGWSDSDHLTRKGALSFSGSGGVSTDNTSVVRVFIDRNNNGVYDSSFDVMNTGTMHGGAWTTGYLSPSAFPDGTYNVYAQINTSSHYGAVSPAGTVTLDGTKPTLAITSDVTSLHAGQTATITFTFSEDPGSTFAWDGTSGDVTLSGGTLGALSGTGATRTAVFTPTANTDNGTASITVAAGAYTDEAGNNGGAGTTPSLTFDTKAPTVAITSDPAALHGGETATVTFTFSEDPGATFSWDGSSGDVVVSGGTLSAISGTGLTRTAVFTPTANTDNGTASITVAAGAYTDAAGNSGGAGTTPAVTFDTQAPTVAITSDHAALHAGQTATITFTFSEDPGATFSWDGSSGDIAVSGGTLSAISGTGLTRTAVFTPTANTDNGTASITIGEGVYSDAAGNGGHAGGTPSLTLDTLAPDAPSAPVLDTNSDSGAHGDNVTTVVTPTLTGTAEAGAIVDLYDGTTLVGAGTADGAGAWSITTAMLAEGQHAIVATATDMAGNTGAASGGLDLTVAHATAASPDHILWQNTANGLISSWGLDDTSASGTSDPAAQGWQVMDAGNFSGAADGGGDVLLRNQSTGMVNIWTNAAGQLHGADVDQATLDWQIMGTADFNGDGKSDILWHNEQNGYTSAWLMNGTQVASTWNPGSVDVSWHVVSAADFNGDGSAGILWRNASSGEVDIWNWNTSLPDGQASGTKVADIGLQWTVAGTGDFNGDGKADILWQDNGTGQVVIWEMNGAHVQDAQAIATLGTQWTVAGVVDANGDGMSDIVWRDSGTGQTVLWAMNGFHVNHQGVLDDAPAGWQIINHHYDWI